MDTEFKCTGCGGRFDKAISAVVIATPDTPAKIMLFCSLECYRTPVLKALDGLEAEQRLGLKNITVWRWVRKKIFSGSWPDAEHMFQTFVKDQAAHEEQLASQGDDLKMLEFEEEKNSPEADDAARRLKRILQSAKPEPSYPQNLRALFHLLRGPIPKGPIKV